MFKRYLYNFLLTLMLAFPQFALAQESQEPKSREVLVKESIENLDSNDIQVAAQAAIYLGIFRATEGVPALLKVLRSSRFLSTSEHIMPKDKYGMSYWVRTDVKGEIINSLGLIGDKRAVPVLKKYLTKPPKYSSVLLENVAYALYQITGKSYKYRDVDGKIKLFQKRVRAIEQSARIASGQRASHRQTCRSRSCHPAAEEQRWASSLCKSRNAKSKDC